MSVIAKLEETKSVATQPPLAASRTTLLLGSSSLFLATVEAVCLFLVTANGIGLLLGGAAITLAHGALLFHAPSIRLPLLLLATVGATLNLWLIGNNWWLRHVPSAQWRRRPLTTKERWRNRLLLLFSILTLFLVGTELYLHHKLHGSILARYNRVLEQAVVRSALDEVPLHILLVRRELFPI